MPKVNFRVRKCNSIAAVFSTAFELIYEFQNGSDYCWFRGSKNRQHELVPGAYRRPGYDESRTLVTFTQEGVAFCNVGGLDDWHTYYLAQHHRIPTRLLDWSESLTAALFFAFDGWHGKTTPCIWITQPGMLNFLSMEWEGVMSPENNPPTRLWLPRMIGGGASKSELDDDGYLYDNEWPLAIYPKKSNARINAQQGMFTIHGRNVLPLTTIVDALGGNCQDIFARLDLVGFSPDKVMHQLRMVGIRRAGVFPDVDSFVQDLQEYYGW